MAQRKIQYPKFIIFELKDSGPLVTTFETPEETAEHLKGRRFQHLAVFKDRKLIHFPEFSDILEQLTEDTL